MKPLCIKNNATLILNDTVREISGRFYVVATATLADQESDGVLEANAYAREPQDKKDMDDSQITGMASSYARKYALNGLFCIDDTKDADTDEVKRQDQKPVKKGEVICESCGIPIKGVTCQGIRYSPDDIADKSIDRYGKRLCWGCMKAANAAEKNHAADNG